MLVIYIWLMYNSAILIFIYLQMYFWGMCTLCNCVGTIPGKEGGIQVLAGLAPISQIVRSLLRASWKNNILGKE
jgi:hypothetical protein